MVPNMNWTIYKLQNHYQAVIVVVVIVSKTILTKVVKKYRFDGQDEYDGLILTILTLN